MNERLRAYGLSAAFIALVAAPAFRDADNDGFPLSTYPMFAHGRDRVNDVAGAVAVGTRGRRVNLAPRFVANSEAMLAVATLRRALDAGPDATHALCESIAQRVAAAREPELGDAQRVELVTRRVDAIDFLAGRVPRTKGHVHVSCPVPRGTKAVPAADGSKP